MRNLRRVSFELVIMTLVVAALILLNILVFKGIQDVRSSTYSHSYVAMDTAKTPEVSADIGLPE